MKMKTILITNDDGIDAECFLFLPLSPGPAPRRAFYLPKTKKAGPRPAKET